MTQVPKITIDHWDKALEFSRESAHFSMLEAVNKAIEIALAEQAAQEQYITAEQAKALGAGNAEYHATGWASWHICGEGCNYFGGYQYRAIRKEVLVEPHVELKANPVKLDGVLMSREAAIAEWERKKNTHLMHFQMQEGNPWLSVYGDGLPKDMGDYFSVDSKVRFELRPKALKPVSWSDMPVGVMINTGIYRGITSDNYLVIEGSGCNRVSNYRHISDAKLAPADQQPWIAVQDTFERIAGLVYATKADAGCGTSPHDMAAFKVIGIAEGWELK